VHSERTLKSFPNYAAPQNSVFHKIPVLKLRHFYTTDDKNKLCIFLVKRSILYFVLCLF